ncbi:helix-turn-helix domain-containing protein [Actinomadura bangladeshensis]|uniref:XRE family transcriptional regulator n=1 Tax=Actinomadura bangladeshensis TaxID=453573 RepID=A0A4R4NTG8_9ACTN|nr:helix-turn-helix transcriptional regulator [Actinomadura bangladeshensis]TDC12689.1 XRE family transcriptional regulator [Actinomadura bangladeshensis]
MASRTSPTVRRRRLASEMRRLRRESGKTREEAAKFADIAPATVSRIEAAVHAPKVADIMALCKFYGLDDDRTEVLVALARQSRQRGWWHQYSGSIPDWFEVYVGLEEEASEVLHYEPEAIPGLLQVEGYIRAISLAGLEAPPDEELERRVALRLKRQERLTSSDAPKVWAILNEGAIRRQVGGPETMRQQLNHLTSLSQLNHINIVVLPFSAGAHPGMHGPCTLLRFPEPADPDVAYVQYRRGSVYLEDPSDISHYVEVFDHLRSRALGPDESRALIARASGEMSEA